MSTIDGEMPPQLQQRCSELWRLSVGSGKDDSDSTSPELGLMCLMDTFLAMFDECQQDCFTRNKNIASFVKKYKEAVKRTKELQIKPSDFEVKATVGRGHFGEVQVVHEKTTDTVYAMKVLRKSDLLSQPDISFFEEERDIMANSNSPWLTRLHFAFQDSLNLYLVMDFHPGGDLLSLLSRHGDQLEEDMARFYLAEMAVAINNLHDMGYLHRDIKPENILLDHSGHIKLADFGSAAKMDSKGKVSSRMPVGTPDYVAPELLDSLNRASNHQRYGVEVDWWSLGVCAYEMLFGCTPFTDDDGSMVATYNNIMNFKNKLKFPPHSSVSEEARDLISQLLSDGKSRLGWPEIQQHPFFKTVDWINIRNGMPPYVPSISSLDDTSHFDEVEKARPAPNVDSFHKSNSRDFTGRQLPFVGFTYFHPPRAPKIKSPKKSSSSTTVLSEDMDSTMGLNTARFLSHVDSSTSITSLPDPRVPLPTTIPSSSAGEVQELRKQCQLLEEKVGTLEAEKFALDKELKQYIAKNQALSHQVEQEKGQAENSDRQSVETWHDLQAMNSQISSLEDQMLSFQLDELREIIVQLESEQEVLTRRLLQKDRQLETLQKSLTTTQQQLSTKQMKLDRERRKSREGQKQNLVMMETQEDSWLKQLEDKQASIDSLTRKLRDLEDLVSAYEEQEDHQAGALQQLHYKLNTSLLSSGGLDSSHLLLDPNSSSSAHMMLNPASPSQPERVSLQVTVRPGRKSVRDNKTVERLKELQTLVDRYAKETNSWRRKEESMQKKITKLEGELKSQRHKEGLSQQTKESLMTKVHVYQQEVHMQRQLIQELQKKMRSYLDEQTTITQTEAKLKDLQCQNLDLEGELFSVKQDAEKTRQSCMDKTREMETIIGKLEIARKQAQEYHDKYCKEVENTDIKIQELEQQLSALSEERSGLSEQVKSLLEQTESLQGLVDEGRVQVDSLSDRNTQLQRQLQDYTMRNAELLKQVESLQKVNKAEEQTATSSRAELQTLLNRLQQQKDDLQQQLHSAHRKCRDQEDKTLSLQREGERLNRRVGRLEGVEREKRELEGRLEGLTALEREKKRLEVRLSHMEDLEREKALLQLQVERLETNTKSLQLEVKEAQQEKKEVENKHEHLLQQQHRHEPPTPHHHHPGQQSPASKKLMLDLLRSEKEELERQVKELKTINVSAKELKDDLEAKEVEVNDLKGMLRLFQDRAEHDETKFKELEDLRVKVTSLESLVKESESREKSVKELREEVKRKQSEVDNLKSEVTSLKNQLKELEKKTREVKALQAEIKRLENQVEVNEEKRIEVNELKRKVRCLESQIKDSEQKVVEGNEKVRKLQDRVKENEEKAKEIKTLNEKVSLLEIEAKENERKTAEVNDLKIKLRSLEDQLNNDKIKSTEGNDIKARLRVFESQSKVKDVKVKTAAGETEQEKSALAAEVRDLKSQLRMKTACVERLEQEKVELERETTAKKAALDRTPSMEGRSRLVERLQTEKAELQRQLERMEKERDSLRLATPKRLRDSGSRDSLSILRESGGKIRAELEDKVQRLERVVSELERKLEISSATTVDKDTLKKEIEELRIQIKETAEAERHDVVPVCEYDSLKESQEKLLEQIKDLQTKVEQLNDEKTLLKRSAMERTESVTRQRSLETRVKTLEEENSTLKEKVSKLEQNQSLLQKELQTEKILVKSREEENSSLKERVCKLEHNQGSLQNKLQTERLMKSCEDENTTLKDKLSELEQSQKSLQNKLESEKKLVKKHEEENSTLKDKLSQLQQILQSLQNKLETEQKLVKSREEENSTLKDKLSKLEQKHECMEEEFATERKTWKEDVEKLKPGKNRVVGDLTQENQTLVASVKSLERQLDLMQKKAPRDTLVGELRHELHESNLALSEARSLLCAGKRQESELRERVDKLQSMLDKGAMVRASNLQKAVGADQELRVLKSQYETLQRQYQNLEARQSGSQREKASTVMEMTLLKDQVQTKQQQLDVEMKKSQRLAALCLELEEQVKDMEAIVSESEKQEAKWNDTRQTYEKAVSEREQELEEANKKLQALSSARSSVDGRVGELSKELKTVQSQHTAQLDKLNTQLRQEKTKAQQMANKLCVLEEKESRYQQVLEVQGENIRAENEVINGLKEELSAKITELQDLKATNLKLNKHLDQAMDKFELIFGEKVSLENFNEALQGGKRFGSGKGREGFGAAGLPLQWTDMQTALEQEHKKTAKLQEQLDALREENYLQANELLKLKGPLKEKVDNKKKTTLTPHKQTTAVATLVRSPSAQTVVPKRWGGRSGGGSGGSRRGYQVPVQPTPQRMHHNIPHRFVTGLNTRATKCGLCLGSVHFVKQASKCQECGMVVHPKCTVSVPATCGLPTEYVRHFADMMSRIEDAELDSTLEPLNIKMEGWLKVPRTGKPGWEKRWVELDGSYLMLYREDTDANPVDTFDLSPPDAEVSVHSAVTAAELTGTASLDLYYVLRLDQDPLTTCWPGRYLYLMTTNFSEKQRWVAALEAAVRSMQRQDRLRKNEPQMVTVVSLKESDRKEFNCALSLSPQLVLLGTDDGLFGLNPQTTSGRQHLVQLSGFGSVHQMAEAKGINMVLLLTGPERRLVMVDGKLIKCRMSQTIGGETTPFSFTAVEGIQRCTVFEVGLWADASYLCVGMPDRVVLLKYNPSLSMYCVRKEMPSDQPCSCMCMAESFVIVGTERFYRISLEHPSLIDFVDRQDSSLAFAAFGAANHHSFPLAVVQVSPDGLPLEFLLCFHEFGVFVDHRGQRSRQSDIKWSGLPLSFSYTEPFLYITYFNSVQATVVPTDRDQVKGCQTAVDLPAPRNLGVAEDSGAIYVASSGNGITEVILVRAHDQRLLLTDGDSDKENMTRQVRFAPSPDKSGGGFQVKTSVSLLSLDSVSSSSTFTSVESTL